MFISVTTAIGVIRRSRFICSLAIVGLTVWIGIGAKRDSEVYAEFPHRSRGLSVAFVQLYRPKSWPDDAADQVTLERRLRKVLDGRAGVDLIILPEAVLYESHYTSTSISVGELNELLMSMRFDGVKVAAGLETSLSSERSIVPYAHIVADPINRRFEAPQLRPVLAQYSRRDWSSRTGNRRAARFSSLFH